MKPTQPNWAKGCSTHWTFDLQSKHGNESDCEANRTNADDVNMSDDGSSHWPEPRKKHTYLQSSTRHAHDCREKKNQGHTFTNTEEFLSLMRTYKDPFIDLYKTDMHVSDTSRHIRVSSKRSFYCLNLKKYLKNSSGDSPTSKLALLAINTERVRHMDRDETTDAFALGTRQIV